MTEIGDDLPPLDHKIRGESKAPPRTFRAWRNEWVAAALARLATPAAGVTLLIVVSLVLRLWFAAGLGLGIDESYMVAAGRRLQLSYFDHPPLAWWLAWGSGHLFGSEHPRVVRLPFVLLFALTTWLMYRLTAVLFDRRAGLYAAIVLNLAPVLGVTSATWVLPDGPLYAGLLGAALCLAKGLPASGRAAWGWWLGAGIGAGLALLAKYSAALTILGALLFMVSEPRSRHWLARPHPYAALALTVALFLPVVIWNARHGWVSFRFQGARAVGPLNLLGPLAALGGAALYFLPWLWLPLVWCGVAALWRGSADRNSWLPVCLAAPPIVFFTGISLWSHVLFHWAAPGYLMLVPLLGAQVERRRRADRPIALWLAATASFVLVGAGLVVGAVRHNWMARAAWWPARGKSPIAAAVDWISLRDELGRRGILDRPGLAVAAIRWLDAGKIDYALGGRIPVLCLGPDPRQYGITAPLADYVGRDLLLIAPGRSLAEIKAEFGSWFAAIEKLAPVEIRDAGKPLASLPLFIGYRLQPPAARAGGTAGSP
jgi:4-amino-4-deoxy-L-arabinose transferase-like glycosyltransferase